jgi:ectoine hydroxylase-related dioxygenase (phytanoyl-CoA dioxygenase family)
MNDINQFHENGVIIIRKALSSKWIEKGVDNFSNNSCIIGSFFNKNITNNGYAHDLFLWKQDNDTFDLAFYSPLPKLAQQLMGSKSVNLLYDQMFNKKPGCLVTTPCHQDLSFWPIKETMSNQLVSFWIPFDNGNEYNSGLKFVKGSHKWHELFATVTADNSLLVLDPNMPLPPNIDKYPNKYQQLSFDMGPGDIYAFYPRTLHGSTSNKSLTRQRRAISLRYLGDSIKYSPTSYTFLIPYYFDLKPGDIMTGSLFLQILPFQKKMNYNQDSMELKTHHFLIWLRLV